MANVLTDASAAANLITTAYDLAAWPSLRPELIFDQFASVRATNQSHNGSAVRFTFVSDLAPVTASLAESTDVDSVALSTSTVTLTLAEKGSAVTTTGLARGTSFVPLDPVAAERVGFNAGISMDTLARLALDGGTNITTITAALTASDFRKTDAALKGRFARAFGDSYIAVIHPDVEYDIRNASDAASWRYFQANNATVGEGIMRGEIGRFEHFRVVTNPRILTTGAGPTKSYKNFFFGQEALAKAYSKAAGYGPYARVEPGPVVDRLKRFVPIGWYWLGAYGVFRQESLQVVNCYSGLN